MDSRRQSETQCIIFLVLKGSFQVACLLQKRVAALAGSIVKVGSQFIMVFRKLADVRERIYMVVPFAYVLDSIMPVLGFPLNASGGAFCFEALRKHLWRLGSR